MSTGQITWRACHNTLLQIFVKTFNHQLVFTWGEQLQSAHMKPPEFFVCPKILEIQADNAETMPKS